MVRVKGVICIDCGKRVSPERAIPLAVDSKTAHVCHACYYGPYMALAPRGYNPQVKGMHCFQCGKDKVVAYLVGRAGQRPGYKFVCLNCGDTWFMPIANPLLGRKVPVGALAPGAEFKYDSRKMRVVSPMLPSGLVKVQQRGLPVGSLPASVRVRLNPTKAYHLRKVKEFVAKMQAARTDAQYYRAYSAYFDHAVAARRLGATSAELGWRQNPREQTRKCPICGATMWWSRAKFKWVCERAPFHALDKLRRPKNPTGSSLYLSFHGNPPARLRRPARSIRLKRIQVGPSYLYAEAYAFEYGGKFYATDAPDKESIRYFVRTGRMYMWKVVSAKSWQDAVKKATEMAMRMARMRGAEIASWEGKTFGPMEQLD